MGNADDADDPVGVLVTKEEELERLTSSLYSGMRLALGVASILPTRNIRKLENGREGRVGS